MQLRMHTADDSIHIMQLMTVIYAVTQRQTGFFIFIFFFC